MIQIAVVNTEKAERLMKALCNHFSQKTSAHYEGDKGYVEFGDGKCELTATASTLTLQVEAQNAEALARLEHVVGDHLQRFTPAEELVIRWGEAQEHSR
jgi:hypothetical protein